MPSGGRCGCGQRGALGGDQTAHQNLWRGLGPVEGGSCGTSATHSLAPQPSGSATGIGRPLDRRHLPWGGVTWRAGLQVFPVGTCHCNARKPWEWPRNGRGYGGRIAFSLGVAGSIPPPPLLCVYQPLICVHQPPHCVSPPPACVESKCTQSNSKFNNPYSKPQPF